MPTLNRYTDGDGYYIKARPSNAGNITYQIAPFAEQILRELGYDDGDNLPWEVIKPLRLADLIYTKGQGTSEEIPFPNRDSSKLGSIEWQKVTEIIEQILSNLDVSEAVKEDLLEYAAQFDTDELDSELQDYEAVYESVSALNRAGLADLVSEIWSLRGFELEQVEAHDAEITALVARHQYPYQSTHLILFQEIGSTALSVSRFNEIRTEFEPQKIFLVDTDRAENKISTEYEVDRVSPHSLTLAIVQDKEAIDSIDFTAGESAPANPALTAKQSEQVSIELVSFNEQVDISSWSFHDGVELQRPVAFFEVHNKSGEVIRWDCGSGAEIVGDDKFRYSGDPGNLHLQTPVFPSSWEKGSQTLQPDIRARGVAFFEELPEGMSAEKLLYTQKYHKGEEATSGMVKSKETFEFDVSSRDNEELPWGEEVDWI